ncbi:hypothetical protein LG200_00695 [Methylobacillus caricis]|uniref:hypothetical protein n=1 Tax=Methylobacillus caricis TaxID=1971611 RepID=UPI001CFFDB03|nr:hypothetical protein [Methylobacillus caricis]MCB5186519.1 hypothetical protein [Methylobacillus caricis]
MTQITSTEWAAWVQAIGSIVAILAAIGISAWQNHVDTNRRRMEQRGYSKRLMSVTHKIAYDIYLTLHNIEQLRSNPLKNETRIMRDFNRSKLGRLEMALHAIPIHNLGTITAVEQVMIIFSQLEAANELLAPEPADMKHHIDHVPCSEIYGRSWRPIVEACRVASYTLRGEVLNYT